MKNVLKKYSDVVKYFCDNPIPKDSENKFQHYKYAGAEIVMHNVNSKLHELGLLLQFVGFEINTEKTRAVGNTIEKITKKIDEKVKTTNTTEKTSSEKDGQAKTTNTTEKISPSNDNETRIFDTLIIYTMKYDLIDIESCESLHFFVDVPFDNSHESKIKGFGSTSTYTQRYVFGEIFHLGFDEANPDASHNSKPQAPKTYSKPQSNATKVATVDDYPPYDDYSQIPPPPQPAPATTPKRNISEKQHGRLMAIAAKNGVENSELKKYSKSRYFKETAWELTQKEYDELCTHLESGEFREKYSLYVK